MQNIGFISKDGFRLLNMTSSITQARENSYRVHRHTDIEICYILSGRGTCKTSGKKFDIFTGDILIFCANELHCMPDIYANEKCSGMEFLTIHFSPQLIWYLENNFSNNNLRVFINNPQSFENKIPQNNCFHHQISENIFRLQNELETKSVNYETAVHMLIIDILIFAVRANCISISATDKKKLCNYELMEKAVKYIDENFTEQIKLKDLASIAVLHENYFCNLFKKMNGLSPFDYILIKRIEKAVELIKTTQDNVLQIAITCGFNNSANFNKAFKRITGITPKDLRK